MIRIGTSGFSYADWVGPVYPPSLPARDYLSYYAREFSTVELNVTYYRVPNLATVASWVGKTPPGFLFAVKAHQTLTHDRTAPDFPAFVASLRPLIEAGKLGCILAQFPYSFHPTAENHGYLERLRAGFGDLPAVVEFRHAGWARPESYAQLKSLGIGYCCVDEPPLPGLMPPVAVTTSPIAYVRFHGRNAAEWYGGEQAWQRYNYTYRQEELLEWLPRLATLDRESERTLVYFNNHYAGQAVQGVRAPRRSCKLAPRFRVASSARFDGR